MVGNDRFVFFRGGTHEDTQNSVYNQSILEDEEIAADELESKNLTGDKELIFSSI